MNKTIIFSLLLCLFIACEDNDTPKDPNNGDYDPEKEAYTFEEYWGLFCYGYQVKDTSNLNMQHLGYTEKDGFVYLSGIRNGKLWIGQFDRDSRIQLDDFQSNELLPDSYTMHLGYGEYFTGKLVNPSATFFFSEGDHWVVSVDLDIIDTNSVMLTKGLSMIIFQNNNQVQTYFTKSRTHTYESVIEWYDNSYLVNIDMNDENVTDNPPAYTCFDKQGNPLFEVNHTFPPNKEIYLVDEKRYLFFTSGYTYSIDEDRGVHHISVTFTDITIHKNSYEPEIIPILETKEADRFEITFINQSGNIQKYKIDLTEFTGERYSRIFMINTETQDFWIE